MTPATLRMIATLLILIGVAIVTPAFPVDGRQSAGPDTAALPLERKATDPVAIGPDQPPGQDLSAETITETPNVPAPDTDVESPAEAPGFGSVDDQSNDQDEDSSEDEEWLQAASTEAEE